MSSGATDPLSAFHLLAAVIHLLLALIPEEAQNASVFWTKLGAPVSIPTPQYPFPQQAQEQLWKLLNSAVPAEIEKQKPTIGALLTELGTLFDIKDVHVDGVLTEAGGTKLRQLLAPGTLSRTVEAVRARYVAVWAEKSWLDDAYFLLPQSQAAASSAARPPHSPATSPARPSAHASTAASPGGSARSNLLTPLRGSNPLGRGPGAVPQTPMSSQLESVGWLREAVQEQVSASSKLEKYYTACEVSPRDDIDARAERLCEKVREAIASTAAPTDVGEQLTLGKRLYYKMLLSFLEAEERRLKHSNFGALLSNAAFHTSLLACCLESVFASYSTSGMAFPAILHTLELQPFDFGKVIESFIKHEPHLPSHLKMHFADVEAKIVEHLAWQDGSPLHALMTEYDAALAVAGAKTGEGGATPPGSTRAKAALEQFVKKCLYLGAKRIQDLCLRLLLPSTLVQQVWEVVKLVLDQARHLLLGRHLDQLLMCAVYGVCKVNQRSVTFRHIIEQYKRQAGASPRTFREVRMRTSTDPPQDIIQFYNLVFIPSMKDHLLRVCSSAGPAALAPAHTAGVSTAGGSSAGDGNTSAPHISPDINVARGTSSPRHVSAGGGRDVYVSALSTPNARDLTPRTRTLYAFSGGTPAGASGADRLRDINTQVNQPAGSDVAQTLSMMSGAPSGAAAAGAGGSEAPSRRGELDLGGSGAGVMASGHKRSRAILEPSRSSTPGGSSVEGEVAPSDGASIESSSIRSRSN